MFFKGNDKTLVDRELLQLQSQISNTTSNSIEEPKFSDLFEDRATCKGIIISLGLLGGQQLSGIFAMVGDMHL